MVGILHYQGLTTNILDRLIRWEEIEVCVNKIKLSPYQVRKFFDEDKKKGLAQSIQQNGLIQPIVVRPKNGHPEIIAEEKDACRPFVITRG